MRRARLKSNDYDAIEQSSNDMGAGAWVVSKFGAARIFAVILGAPTAAGAGHEIAWKAAIA